MAEREFIETREIVYVNAPIAPILQGDSVHYEDIAFKAQIGRIHSFSEQEIVKPYLEAIEAEAIKYSGTGEREIQAYDEGLLKAIEIIKKLLSEQEAKHGSN